METPRSTLLNVHHGNVSIRRYTMEWINRRRRCDDTYQCITSHELTGRVPPRRVIESRHDNAGCSDQVELGNAVK